MTRLPDWQSKLSVFMDEHEDGIFGYGRLDCCIFVCDAIQVMTGIDVAGKYRGTYLTRFGALQSIEGQTGGKSIRHAVKDVTDAFGMRNRPITEAQRGDVVSILRPRDISLGIVDLSGERIAVVSIKGLLRIPIATANSSWQV